MDPDPNVLSEPMAARLLARASELDQLHKTGSSINDLRLAATEAGIAEPAFDAALAELQSRAPSRAVDARGRARRRTRLVIWTAVLTMVAAAATLAVVAQRTARSDVAVSTAPLIDDAILLQCLAPDEAAALIRPVLTLRENQVIVRPTQTPRLLMLRATAGQLQRVKALLAPYEVADSPTCRTRPVR